MFRRIAAALLVCIACAPASALAAETQFLLLKDADTVAVERFHASPERLQGSLRVSGLRMEYTLEIATPAAPARPWPTRFELSLRRIAAPDSAPPLQRLLAVFAGDSVRVTTGAAAEQVAAGIRGAWPFANPSMALLARAIHGVRPAAGDSAIVPLFMPSGTRVLPAVLRSLGPDSVRIELGGVEVRFSLDAAGEVTGGSIPVQGVRIVAGPAGADDGFGAPTKPDYSAPADAPYTAEPVRMPVAGGFELAGTLTVPRGASRAVPCVLTITGSGLEDRDEAIPLVKGYRPFRQVADALARAGIATLRLDDRGYGESGGDPARATSADFAHDTRAALAWLRTQKRIDGRRLVLLGHSEGGLIAPMVAADDRGICALVLLAAPARAGRNVIEYQQREAISHVPGLDDAAREERVRAAMAQVDSSATSSPWLAYFLAYDPLPAARRVRVPVLVLQGATDRQVESAQAEELAAAMRAGGNRDVTVNVLPGTNHLFLADPSGDPAGYPRLAERAIRPEVLAIITDWLADRVR